MSAKRALKAEYINTWKPIKERIATIIIPIIYLSVKNLF